MENASKALIMAGGVLIAILLISLLVYAWGLFSQYQSNNNSLSDIEDTSKFNEQFEQYNRNDVMGYELLSLINKVIDYNETQSNDTLRGNNTNYKCISLNISFNDHKNDMTTKLSYQNKMQLFTKTIYLADDLTSSTSGSRATFKKDIEAKVTSIINSMGGKESEVEKLARNINSVFMTENDIDEKAKRENKEIDDIHDEMLSIYNSIVTNNTIKDYNELIIKDGSSSNRYYNSACAYYEYIQFKKAIFECKKVVYDTDVSGRITSISFEWTGNIK